LQELRIVLPDNTAANRVAFQAKLPLFEIEFGRADAAEGLLV
jgi:hypothetical protein